MFGIFSIVSFVIFFLAGSFSLAQNIQSKNSSPCKASFAVSEKSREVIKHFFKDRTHIEYYAGVQKQMELANRYVNSDMGLLFKNINSSTDPKVMTLLKWIPFDGSTKQYIMLRHTLLTERNQVRENSRHMIGYLETANRFFKNDMLETFITVSQVLNSQQMLRLQWGEARNESSAHFLEKLQNQILDERQRVRPKFIGLKGFITLSNSFSNKMGVTYRTVALALSEKSELFTFLHWPRFAGNLREFLFLLGKFQTPYPNFGSFYGKYNKKASVNNLARNIFVENEIKRRLDNIHALTLYFSNLHNMTQLRNATWIQKELKALNEKSQSARKKDGRRKENISDQTDTHPATNIFPNPSANYVHVEESPQFRNRKNVNQMTGSNKSSIYIEWPDDIKWSRLR